MEFSNHKRSQDSQRSIYKGLREILKRKDLKDVTVVDIQKQCKISRTTFYRNFHNVIDVLEVIFKWHYDEYETNRLKETNQLLYFLKFWINHRDLLTIIVENNIEILKKCIINYSTNKNPIYIECKYALISSIIIYWSKTDRNLSPEQYYKIISKELYCKAYDLLIL